MEEAHTGTPAELAEFGGPHTFYPDPGALWVADKSCGQCHRLFGQGGRVGPDLTGAQRSNLTYLVENIVSPSASLAETFRMSTVELKQGRVINGVVLSQTPRAITIQTPTEQMVVANRVGGPEPGPSVNCCWPRACS